MYDFISFLSKRDSSLFIENYEAIYEMSVTEVESLQPKDGKWYNKNTYAFNVEGDECGTKDQPCYTVTIGDDGAVAFQRSKSYSDNNAGFGPRVFEGVHYAIWEYVKKNNPEHLSWAPVSKTSVNKRTGKVENPEARKKVYEIFALKSLFPDLYLSPTKNFWVRRDIYEKTYVERGYPAIPENLTTNSDIKSKKEFLNQIRDKHTKYQLKPTQSEVSVNASYGLNAVAYMTPELYRSGLSIGDFVSPNFDENHIMKGTHGSSFYQNIDSYQRFAQELYEIKSNKGQIINFYQKYNHQIRNNDYYAEIKFVGENENQYKIYVLDVRDIVKYEESNLIVQQFKERTRDTMQSALNSDYYNPHKLAVGMKIIHDQGSVGYIQSIDWVSQNDKRYGLKAEIQWKPQESLKGSERPDRATFPLNSYEIGVYNDENVRAAQHFIDSRNAANAHAIAQRNAQTAQRNAREVPTETHDDEPTIIRF